MRKIKTNKLINFLFEAATLKRLKRTGWQILGGGNDESVAEHTFMVSVIAYLIAKELKADIEKVLVMSLFHDFIETRIGDIYKLADLYVKADESKAAKDAFSSLSQGKGLTGIINEYERNKTFEAKIVHDADNIALCLELKQLMERGNKDAQEWFKANKKRIYLKESHRLLNQIEKTNSQDWWKKERDKIHKTYTKE